MKCMLCYVSYSPLAFYLIVIAFNHVTTLTTVFLYTDEYFILLKYLVLLLLLLPPQGSGLEAGTRGGTLISPA